MNNNYVTKEDLKELLSALETRLLSEMAAMETRIEEKISEAVSDSETRLLKAIYGYVETIESKVVGFSAGNAELRLRMEILERRVLDVERRANLGNLPR